MKYQEQNSKEIKEIIEKVKVAILPLGAVEAHGPHLPLGTDNYLSERIAEKLSENVAAFLCVSQQQFPEISLCDHSNLRKLLHI